MRIVLLVVGTLLLLVGAVSMFTPFFGGTFLIGAGGALIICNSARAARWVQHMRGRSSRMDRMMRWVEDRLGERMGDALRRTRPPGDDKM